MTKQDTQFCLFVYGSLRRGQENHDAYCAGHVEAVEATVLGKLYQQPDGYPMLVVPPAHVLAVGTSDPMVDLETYRLLAAVKDWRPPVHDDGNWVPVEGDLLTFDNPVERMARLDKLEDFRPGPECLYHRVVTMAEHETIEPVWTYVAPQGRIPPGSTPMAPRWP